MNGWILYDRQGIERNRKFAEILCQEGQKRGHTMEIMVDDSLSYGIVGGKSVILIDGNPCTPPDFVIRRNYSAMLCRHMEQMGIRVMNDSFACDVCNNKLKTAQVVHELGIPVADTFFNCAPPFYPCVVKPAGGHGGKNVFLVNNRREYENAVSVIQNDDIVIQSVEDKGRDLRIYVTGTEIIAAVMRTCENDFRSNFSLGGKAELHTPTGQERDIALTVAEKFNFDFAGIDLIYRSGKPILNEIEDVAGCRMLYANGITDVPSRIFERLN